MKQIIKHQFGKRKVVVIDTVSYLDETNNGNVVVAGSHCGSSAARYVIENFNLNGIILNDAGKGKEDAGIAGLEIYERAKVPAAAIDNFTARIGDGLDCYEYGIISAINKKAEQCGIKPGIAAKKAAQLMINGVVIEDK